MTKKNKRNSGTVYLVGAGPGDPGLFTLRGAFLLRHAEAVVHDWLVNQALLELAPGAEKFYVGKNLKLRDKKSRSAKGYVEQDETNRLLVKLARTGKTVVRLKGGDPFIFGRGGEEAAFLKKHGIRFEVVPGISAGYAAPAYAGIPVTDRRFASLVTFVTGHEDPAKKESFVRWSELAKIGGTIVSFMGVGNLPKIVSALIRAGKSPKTPVSVIQWGTLPHQRVVEGSLATISKKVSEAKITSPALTVIGEVNRLRRELAWYENRPLSGKTILITRARAQASVLRTELEKRGAAVLEFPAIEIVAPDDFRPLDQAILGIPQWDWVVFTSVNGVSHFFKRLAQLKKDSRVFSGVKVAAIGEATSSALLEKGIRADLIGDTFTSAALVEKLKREDEIKGRRFLLPRTDIAPEDLRKGLEACGGKVTEVTAYRTVASHGPEERRKLVSWISGRKIDFVTFTSSSTVKNFFDAIPRAARRKIRSGFVSIGPVTSRTLRGYGVRPIKEAAEHTIAGLVKVLTHGHS